MQCPKCNSAETKVVHLIKVHDGKKIKRRRMCDKCGYRFTTSEIEVAGELYVIKKNGDKQEFDIEKIAKILFEIMPQKPFDAEVLSVIIQDRVYALDVHKIPSETIREIIVEELSKEDKKACQRYREGC